jgi:hypothetical protein
MGGLIGVLLIYLHLTRTATKQGVLRRHASGLSHLHPVDRKDLIYDDDDNDTMLLGAAASP